VLSIPSTRSDSSFPTLRTSKCNIETSREEKEEKIFYWQKEGVGIGNVASGALANGTLLVGERKMLKEMKEQGYRILLYKRYIDDILAIFEHQDVLQKRKGAEMMEKPRQQRW